MDLLIAWLSIGFIGLGIFIVIIGVFFIELKYRHANMVRTKRLKELSLHTMTLHNSHMYQS